MLKQNYFTFTADDEYKLLFIYSQDQQYLLQLNNQQQTTQYQLILQENQFPSTQSILDQKILVQDQKIFIFILYVDLFQQRNIFGCQLSIQQQNQLQFKLIINEQAPDTSLKIQVYFQQQTSQEQYNSNQDAFNLVSKDNQYQNQSSSYTSSSLSKTQINLIPQSHIPQQSQPYLIDLLIAGSQKSFLYKNILSNERKQILIFTPLDSISMIYKQLLISEEGFISQIKKSQNQYSANLIIYTKFLQNLQKAIEIDENTIIFYGYDSGEMLIKVDYIDGIQFQVLDLNYISHNVFCAKDQYLLVGDKIGYINENIKLNLNFIQTFNYQIQKILFCYETQQKQIYIVLFEVIGWCIIQLEVDDNISLKLVQQLNYNTVYAIPNTRNLVGIKDNQIYYLNKQGNQWEEVSQIQIDQQNILKKEFDNKNKILTILYSDKIIAYQIIENTIVLLKQYQIMPYSICYSKIINDKLVYQFISEPIIRIQNIQLKEIRQQLKQEEIITYSHTYDSLLIKNSQQNNLFTTLVFPEQETLTPSVIQTFLEIQFQDYILFIILLHNGCLMIFKEIQLLFYKNYGLNSSINFLNQKLIINQNNSQKTYLLNLDTWNEEQTAQNVYLSGNLAFKSKNLYYNNISTTESITTIKFTELDSLSINFDIHDDQIIIPINRNQQTNQLKRNEIQTLIAQKQILNTQFQDMSQIPQYNHGIAIYNKNLNLIQEFKQDDKFISGISCIQISNQDYIFQSKNDFKNQISEISVTSYEKNKKMIFQIDSLEFNDLILTIKTLKIDNKIYIFFTTTKQIQIYKFDINKEKQLKFVNSLDIFTSLINLDVKNIDNQVIVAGIDMCQGITRFIFSNERIKQVKINKIQYISSLAILNQNYTLIGTLDGELQFLDQNLKIQNKIQLDEEIQCIQVSDYLYVYGASGSIYQIDYGQYIGECEDVFESSY